MASRYLFRSDTAQIEQRKAKGRCQERRLQVHRDHDRHPFGVKRPTIDDRPHDGHHDVNDLKEVEHEAKHEEHQHHDQEDFELVVKALEELLDIVFATERDHHEIQQL